MRFNRETFFSRYHANFGKLNQKQVDGLNFLLDKLEKDTLTLEQSAYVLATVAHETGRAFQPIKEKRGRVGTKIRRTQDKYWGTDAYGRGYVQITWPENYAKFGLRAKADYDKALEPEKAYEILSVGMRKGVFTGKKLTDYILAGDVDYVNARKIVNGLDKAKLIAGIAEKFKDILHASLATGAVTKEGEEPTPEVPAQINVEHADTVEAPPQALPKPEEVKVQSLAQSLLSKVMAGGTAVLGGITAVFGFVTKAFDKHPLPMTILVLGILAIAAYMWNESKKRRDAREALIVQKAASQTENTVVLT